MGLSEAYGTWEKRRTMFTAHWVPGRRACPCHRLGTLGSPGSRYSCGTHITDETTETQGGYAAWPGSRSWGAEAGIRTQL